MDDQESLARVVRVTRHDTLIIRYAAPQVPAMITCYMVLEGIKPKKAARAAIVDWVEVHSDAERLRLVTPGWVRDGYGRLLADLADRQTGELLTSYLLEMGLAEPYEYHAVDVLEELIRSQEPEL